MHGRVSDAVAQIRVEDDAPAVHQSLPGNQPRVGGHAGRVWGTGIWPRAWPRSSAFVPAAAASTTGGFSPIAFEGASGPCNQGVWLCSTTSRWTSPVELTLPPPTHAPLPLPLGRGRGHECLRESDGLVIVETANLHCFVFVAPSPAACERGTPYGILRQYSLLVLLIGL